MEISIDIFLSVEEIDDILLLLAKRRCNMTDDKLYTSLSANTIMAKLTNHV